MELGIHVIYPTLVPTRVIFPAFLVAVLCHLFTLSPVTLFHSVHNLVQYKSDILVSDILEF